MLQDNFPRLNKPYILYNNYGDGMVAHPAIPTLLCIPNPYYIRKEDVPEIIDAMMLLTKLEGRQMEWLKREVIELIFKYWGKVTLPAFAIIRS